MALTQHLRRGWHSSMPEVRGQGHPTDPPHWALGDAGSLVAVLASAPPQDPLREEEGGILAPYVGHSPSPTQTRKPPHKNKTGPGKSTQGRGAGSPQGEGQAAWAQPVPTWIRPGPGQSSGAHSLRTPLCSTASRESLRMSWPWSGARRRQRAQGWSGRERRLPTRETPVPREPPA